MFPGRLAQLPAGSFAQLATLLENEKPGGPAINLSIGDPRGAVPDFVMEALAKHAHQFGEYPAINGTQDWRDAAANWLRTRFHLPEQVMSAENNLLPLCGTREGLFLAPFIVTPERKAGGRPVILLPNPFYQAYAAAIAASGAEPVYVRADAESGFLPDFASLPKSVLERTVAVYLCSPSNPEGAVATQSYWRALFALADTHDFTIFADECYADIYFGREPLSALTARYEAGGDISRLLTFHSLSKRSCLPGLRSGIVAGDPKLIATFRQFRNYAGPQLSMPIQAASAAAWRDEAHVARNRAIFAARFEAARDVLGNRIRVPQAGMFLWMEVGDGVEATRKLWREGGIRVLPGAYMGRESEPGKPQSNPGFSYIRVALVSDLSTIKAALARMGEILGGGH
ncbi:MAG TPA: aminotransferase class I/II-fold pyridoxal phosphate-dependent enzyme [Rhizomicrobium sp.]|jgi:aspartate/methionine/tyrosine aminotransferase